MNRARHAAALNRLAWEVIKEDGRRWDGAYFVDYGKMPPHKGRANDYKGNGVVLIVSDPVTLGEGYIELTKEQEVKAKLCWLTDLSYPTAPWLGADLKPEILWGKDDGT